MWSINRRKKSKSKGDENAGFPQRGKQQHRRKSSSLGTTPFLVMRTSTNALREIHNMEQVKVIPNVGSPEHGYVADEEAVFAHLSENVKEGSVLDQVFQSIDVMKGQIKTLQEENETQNAQIKTLQNANKTLQEENETQNAQIKTLQNANKTLQDANKILQEENETQNARIKTLQNANKTLQDANKALQAENETRKADIKSLQIQHKALQEQDETRKADIKILQSVVQVLHEKNETRKAQIKALHGEYKKQKEQIKTFRDTKTKSDRNIYFQAHIVKYLREENLKTLRYYQDMHTQEVSRLLSRIDALQQELSTLKSRKKFFRKFW